MFWKGPNKTGTYPSCKECERLNRVQQLLNNPLCCRCKRVPHMNGSAYCYQCTRDMKGLGVPTRKKRKVDTHLCPRCLIRERGDQPYCPPCKLDYQNETRAKKWAQRYVGNDAKRIETARAFATGLLARGKIRRGPCVFCGDPGIQFHHYDYELRTRNFEDVCCDCHRKAHQFLQFVVDSFRYHGVRVVQLSVPL